MIFNYDTASKAEKIKNIQKRFNLVEAEKRLTEGENRQSLKELQNLLFDELLKTIKNIHRESLKRHGFRLYGGIYKIVELGYYEEL